MARRDAVGDPSTHDLVCQLAVAPLVDRPVRGVRLLTRQHDDLADLLRAQAGCRAGSRISSAELEAESGHDVADVAAGVQHDHPRLVRQHEAIGIEHQIRGPERVDAAVDDGVLGEIVGERLPAEELRVAGQEDSAGRPITWVLARRWAAASTIFK